MHRLIRKSASVMPQNARRSAIAISTRLLQKCHRPRRMLSTFCVLHVAFFAMSAVAEAGRFNRTLDDGVTVIVVDNYSSYSDAHAEHLALGADRSTQDDGMWYRPRKG
jgi:hypothetical protein